VLLPLAGIRVLYFSTPQKEICAPWRKGPLMPHVAEALALKDAAIARRRMAVRDIRGKTVLLTDQYEGRVRGAASSAPIPRNTQVQPCSP
jgi:hypothetical protein